jgi:hypothetical protein
MVRDSDRATLGGRAREAFRAEVDVVLEHLRTTANRESLARSKRPKMEGRRTKREG